jgi:hypothetical protein
MALGLAVSVCATLLKFARVLAFTADTGKLIRTFEVTLASRLSANGIWVPNKALSTGAGCHMVVDATFCILATGECGAGILAAFLYACKVQRAFWISPAFRLWRKFATCLRRSNVPIRTGASHFMIKNLASCQGCTGITLCTWTDALTVLACCIIWTIIII